MTAKRKVNTARTFYTSRPGPAPKKRVGRPDPKVLKQLLKIAALVVAVFGLWQIFAVANVRVAGNSVIQEAEIKQIIDQSFARHPFSKNLLTLFLAPLQGDILSDQRVSNANISRSWPNSLIVTITERQLSLVWKSGDRAYLLDSKGVAVAEGISRNLPQVTDNTSLPVRVGDRVAPQGFVSFTSKLGSELTSKTGLEVGGMSVPDTTSELDVMTKTGFTVKFDTSAEVEEQLGSLKTVMTTLSRLQKKPSQYIDLRVPGKAYYL